MFGVYVLGLFWRSAAGAAVGGEAADQRNPGGVPLNSMAGGIIANGCDNIIEGNTRPA